MNKAKWANVCDVWIIERMRYRPTDRPTNGYIHPYKHRTNASYLMKQRNKFTTEADRRNGPTGQSMATAPYPIS